MVPLTNDIEEMIWKGGLDRQRTSPLATSFCMEADLSHVHCPLFGAHVNHLRFVWFCWIDAYTPYEIEGERAWNVSPEWPGCVQHP